MRAEEQNSGRVYCTAEKVYTMSKAGVLRAVRWLVPSRAMGKRWKEHPSYRIPCLLGHSRANSCGVSYPLQLSSVTENHAALYEESLKHPEQFWGDLARRRLRWIKEFDQVMDCDMSSGRFTWFNRGTINISGWLSI